jgi:hypothetical protein
LAVDFAVPALAVFRLLVVYFWARFGTSLPPKA